MRELTGKEIHEAYNKVQLDDVKLRGQHYTPTTVNKWEDLSKREKALFDGLARYLNELIAEQEMRA